MALKSKAGPAVPPLRMVLSRARPSRQKTASDSPPRSTPDGPSQSGKGQQPRGDAPSSSPVAKGSGKQGKKSKGKREQWAQPRRPRKPDKRKSRCRGCGGIGHWVGDPDCPLTAEVLSAQSSTAEGSDARASETVAAKAVSPEAKASGVRVSRVETASARSASSGVKVKEEPTEDPENAALAASSSGDRASRAALVASSSGDRASLSETVVPGSILRQYYSVPEDWTATADKHLSNLRRQLPGADEQSLIKALVQSGLHKVPGDWPISTDRLLENLQHRLPDVRKGALVEALVRAGFQVERAAQDLKREVSPTSPASFSPASTASLRGVKRRRASTKTEKTKTPSRSRSPRESPREALALEGEAPAHGDERSAKAADHDALGVHPSRKDRGLGVPDSACKIAVAGDRWWSDYKEDLIEAGLSDFVIEREERERYIFGNDGAKYSFKHVTCRGMVGGRAQMLGFSVLGSAERGHEGTWQRA